MASSAPALSPTIHATALLVGARLNDYCARGVRCLALGGQSETQISIVDTHERLAGLYLLTGIDEPLDNLARHAKAEIALDPRSYRAGECPLGASNDRSTRDLHELRDRARIGAGR